MDLMELMWSLSIELHWGGRVLAQMGIKLRGVCVCVGGGGFLKCEDTMGSWVDLTKNMSNLSGFNFIYASIIHDIFFEKKHVNLYFKNLCRHN